MYIDMGLYLLIYKTDIDMGFYLFIFHTYIDMLAFFC